jgi:type VI secretion system protein VasG
VIKQIVKLQLNKIGKRVKDAYKASFVYAPELVETIAARCKESSSGARNVENILSRTLLPELSAEVLSRMAAGEAITEISVGIGAEGSFQYQLS